MEKRMGPENKDYKELNELEKEAGDLLKELAQLTGVTRETPTQPNYLNVIRDMQNKMRANILQGIQKTDRDLFLKGLEFYEKNYAILESTGDKRVCEDYQYEMIQFLTDLIVEFKREISNPTHRYFIILSLQFVAKIYEDANNFARAIEIRLTISNILNSWAAALEYAANVLNYLLNDEIDKARKSLGRFDSLESKVYLLDNNIIEQSMQSKRILNLKEFCENVIAGIEKDLPIFFEDAKELLAELNLQENHAFNRVVELFVLVKDKFERTRKVEAGIPLEPITTTSSDPQLITNLKNLVLESIQSQQGPKSTAPSGGTFDTSSIVTELKQFISSSIKDLSQEIIQNVSKFTMATSQTPRARSSHTFDENIPEIKIADRTDPDEKPKRPKLSDVLDSIVVSE